MQFGQAGSDGAQRWYEATGHPIRAGRDEGGDFVPEDEQGRPLPRETWPQRRAANGETFRAEFTVTAPDRTRRRFEANARPVQHDGHESGVLVIRDITDRGLLRLQDELLALASHELRTPLTALFGYLQLHLRHVESGQTGESVHRSITRAIEQVEHLRVLVDDLLDVERLQTGKLSLRRVPTDLVALVSRVVAFAESLAAGKTLRPALPSEPLIVDGDPVRLEQVLLNLIANAVEHAPDTDTIDVSLQSDGGQALLEVRDHGPGIPAAEVGRIFSRFRQVGQGRQAGARGLGLGLYIAHEIVTEHGGTIRADSVEGQGTRFTVSLPLMPAPPST